MDPLHKPVERFRMTMAQGIYSPDASPRTISSARQVLRYVYEETVVRGTNCIMDSSPLLCPMATTLLQVLRLLGRPDLLSWRY